MNKISEENRREAHYRVDKNKRELQVLTILNLHCELTPSEIAEKMALRKYTVDHNGFPKVDVTTVRPRLTELLKKRQVCIVGRKKIENSNNHEGVYQITPKGQERLRGENL